MVPKALMVAALVPASDWSCLHAVLLSGRSSGPGGHLRGVAHPGREAAARGEAHPQEDLRLLFTHHQGPGGQHGPAGRPAEEGGWGLLPREVCVYGGVGAGSPDELFGMQ